MTGPEEKATTAGGLTWAIGIALVAAVGLGAYGVKLRQELASVAARCSELQKEAEAATGVLRAALAPGESQRDQLRHRVQALADELAAERTAPCRDGCPPCPSDAAPPVRRGPTRPVPGPTDPERGKNPSS